MSSAMLVALAVFFVALGSGAMAVGMGAALYLLCVVYVESRDLVRQTGHGIRLASGGQGPKAPPKDETSERDVRIGAW